MMFARSALLRMRGRSSIPTDLPLRRRPTRNARGYTTADLHPRRGARHTADGLDLKAATSLRRGHRELADALAQKGAEGATAATTPSQRADELLHEMTIEQEGDAARLRRPPGAAESC